MHSAQALSLLALVGSALAVPAPHYRHQGNVVYKTVVHTAVVTEVVGAQPQTPKPEPTSAPAPPPAPVTSVKVVEVTPTPTPTPVVESEAPTETGYMAIVDEYRAKLGLSKLTQDATLEANALKTAQDGNGQMVHELNPGSFAQVLAPGGPDDFKHCFVGGWLCEKPDLPGLNGECATESEGWYYTSTGHADILTSPSYSKIGCGNAGGIWGCDLA